LRDVLLCPGGCRIIVRPDDEGYDESAFGDKTKVVEKDGKFFTEGGIEIPQSVEDQVKRRALTGTVIATGPALSMEFSGEDGAYRLVEPDDVVLFGQFSGHNLERSVPGYEDCIIMAEDDVIAIVESL
jgi:co-chaperonin GroES (HSP10)